jgi:hypothetical protein
MEAGTEFHGDDERVFVISTAQPDGVQPRRTVWVNNRAVLLNAFSDEAAIQVAVRRPAKWTRHTALSLGPRDGL